MAAAFVQLTEADLERGRMEAMGEKQLPLSNDLAFKMLLQDEESLKSLLQSFLPLPEGSLVVEAKREDKEETPEDVNDPVGRTFILDLKVTIRRKEGDSLQKPEMVNVEIQTGKDNYFTRSPRRLRLPYLLGATQKRGKVQ